MFNCFNLALHSNVSIVTKTGFREQNPFDETCPDPEDNFLNRPNCRPIPIADSN